MIDATYLILKLSRRTAYCSKFTRIFPFPISLFLISSSPGHKACWSRFRKLWTSSNSRTLNCLPLKTFANMNLVPLPVDLKWVLVLRFELYLSLRISVFLALCLRQNVLSRKRNCKENGQTSIKNAKNIMLCESSLHWWLENISDRISRCYWRWIRIILSVSIIDDELYQESCCTSVAVLSVWAYQCKQMIDLIISIRYERYNI